MSREVEAIASALFDKIRTRFDDVRLGDDKSKATTDPEKARFINFDYTVDGEKIGKFEASPMFSKLHFDNGWQNFSMSDASF